MTQPPTEKLLQVRNMLCEGSSMRAIARVCDVGPNTVDKLLIQAGLTCARFHYEAVRGVTAKRILRDEIWAGVYAKAKNVAPPRAAPDRAGDLWTWTALDSSSKMIVSYPISDLDGEFALTFVDYQRSRPANRVQLTTDGHKAYVNAAERASGTEVGYAMLVTTYGDAPEAEKRYRLAQCAGARRESITGKPACDDVSTSHVERSNLSMRMQMRRFTRLTNGHFRKLENHCHMVSPYTVWCNFVRRNSAVRTALAMAAGVSDGF